MGLSLALRVFADFFGHRCRYLNLGIRFDTNDEWSLRMNVRQLDKETILASKKSRSGQQSVGGCFREKMMREVIYKPRFWTTNLASQS